MSDEPWSYYKVRELVYGRARGDSESGDGYADVELASAYQLRCAAVDKGRPELMLDAIQFDNALDKVRSSDVRAAVCLALMGWDEFEIDGVLKSRHSANTLIRRGVDMIHGDETTRAV